MTFGNCSSRDRTVPTHEFTLLFEEHFFGFMRRKLGALQRCDERLILMLKNYAAVIDALHSNSRGHSCRRTGFHFRPAKEFAFTVSPAVDHGK